jgi:hypothetical protein
MRAGRKPWFVLTTAIGLVFELLRAMGWSGEKELYERLKRVDREPEPRRPRDP